MRLHKMPPSSKPAPPPPPPSPLEVLMPLIVNNKKLAQQLVAFAELIQAETWVSEAATWIVMASKEVGHLEYASNPALVEAHLQIELYSLANNVEIALDVQQRYPALLTTRVDWIRAKIAEQEAGQEEEAEQPAT